MPRRSDARERMIVAARGLYRERGYVGTAFSNVLTESGAPRGSVAYHFPGGKDELAREVVRTHSTDTRTWFKHMAAKCSTPAELARMVLLGTRDHLVKTGYSEGCPIGAIVVESVHATERLASEAGQAFSATIDTLATLFEGLGAKPEQAAEWALTVVTGFEGALIVAKATRSPAAFDSLVEIVETQMAASTPVAITGG